MRASPLDRFFTVAVPLARPGFFTAAVLGFAHTIGEFGVVLMIGGNIPGETRVASIAIYDHVEGLEYAHAHWLSACAAVTFVPVTDGGIWPESPVPDGTAMTIEVRFNIEQGEFRLDVDLQSAVHRSLVAISGRQAAARQP